MPASTWLWIHDPMTSPALTFSGIYDMALDFDRFELLTQNNQHRSLRGQRFQDFNPVYKHFSQMLLCLFP